MTKEMLKAIRLVSGFTSDLRIKLPYSYRDCTPQEAKIRNFLLNHLIDIYGAGIYDILGISYNPQPGKDIADYEKLLMFVENESRAVLLGKCE